MELKLIDKNDRNREEKIFAIGYFGSSAIMTILGFIIVRYFGHIANGMPLDLITWIGFILLCGPICVFCVLFIIMLCIS